jgi:alpha/beta hydrolase fold
MVLDVTPRPGPDDGAADHTVTFQPAHLQLRGSSGPLSACVRWPGPTPPRPKPGLLVFVGGLPLGRHLGAAARLVLLGLDAGPGVDDAVSVTGWAADHASELGADADRLVVGGWGRGAWTAAAVAASARDEGWPPLRAQLLIAPTAPPTTDTPATPATTGTHAGTGLPSGAGAARFDDPTGLAPAVVVLPGRGDGDGGPAAAYVRRLRASGVPVEVVGLGDGGPDDDPVATVTAALDRAVGPGRDAA